MNGHRSHERHDQIAIPRAVLFDLDGTLVDSLDDISHALNGARAEVGLAAVHRDLVRSWIGGGAARLIARSLGTEDENEEGVAEMLARFLRVYGTKSGARSRVLPGVSDLLRRLAERGVLLACTTNKPAAATELVLRATGLGPLFAAVVTPDTLGVRKPDPRFFEEALRLLGGLPARGALVVGDGVPDIAGGHAIGADSVAVLGGYGDRAALIAAAPRFTVENTSDLVARMGL